LETLLFLACFFGGLAWDLYQVIFKKRIAMPVRTPGAALYVERTREPVTFWMIVCLHAAFWILVGVGIYKAR
jgi:hypothetical protein